MIEAAAPRPRVERFEEVKLPEGKVLVPGIIECQSNYIEYWPARLASR